MDISTALRGPATIELDEAKVARQCAWFFGHEGGEEPGSFVTSLLEAISHADAENRGLLALVFPAYVAAMDAEASR